MVAGDRRTAHPGSSHADIACVVVDTLAGVICRSTVTACITRQRWVQVIAAVGALLIALLVIVALWPGPKWQRMCARLPWLLAIPHALVLATSALLLFADGGLLYDGFPYFTPPMDRFGIGLGLTLAVKSVKRISAVDLSGSIERKTAVGRRSICAGSLGYSRRQCLNWLLLPSVAPALAMA